MQQRKEERTPPPALEEIRKRLDWIYNKDRVAR
jgi:hypothetical protein